MASRATISFLRSLHQKKFRQEEASFLVEGPKLVEELLASGFKINRIFSTSQWSAPGGTDLSLIEEISQKELEQVSTLHTPNKVLAVAAIPDSTPVSLMPSSGLHLMVDQVQDPGNLGTILRIADWFGFESIICSPDTVELYNPKVVQSTMGSIFRMKVSYQALPGALAMNAEKARLPVYATVLDGKNLYETPLSKNAWIIVGNESRGILPLIRPFVTHSILIPAFASFKSQHAESLNVAIATGIICSEFRRTR